MRLVGSSGEQVLGRTQQHAQRTGVRDDTALVGGDVPGERVVQSHTRNEVIDEGQRTEALDVQGRANHFACVPEIFP
jgi:hypothetical protein